MGTLRGQLCGGRLKYGVSRERKWGDQAEQEEENGEQLGTGGAGGPGLTTAFVTQEEARDWQQAELESTVW